MCPQYCDPIFMILLTNNSQSVCMATKLFQSVPENRWLVTLIYWLPIYTIMHKLHIQRL